MDNNKRDNTMKDYGLTIVKVAVLIWAVMFSYRFVTNVIDEFRPGNEGLEFHTGLFYNSITPADGYQINVTCLVGRNPLTLVKVERIIGNDIIVGEDQYVMTPLCLRQVVKLESVEDE